MIPHSFISFIPNASFAAISSIQGYTARDSKIGSACVR